MNDEDYEDELDLDDEIEDALEQCGQHGDGWANCLLAGTEYCDFECPYRELDLGMEENEQKEK